jgi:hypothetical protein
MQSTAQAPARIKSNVASPQIWTVGRIAPILAIIAITLFIVAAKPPANIVLLAIVTEIACVGVIWKKWVITT